MAQRRLRAVLEPPSRLITYNPAEWVIPAGITFDINDVTTWSPMWRWRDARHKWIKANGPESSLGSMVDAFREERALWEARNGYVA